MFPDDHPTPCHCHMAKCELMAALMEQEHREMEDLEEITNIDLPVQESIDTVVKTKFDFQWYFNLIKNIVLTYT